MENDRKKELAWAFGFLILLILVRSPQLLLDARFWAEEGRNYFAYAYKNGISSLVWVYPTCGYYYLFTSLATWLASLFPVAVAPYITTYLALAVQILLLAAILYLPSYLFLSHRVRILAALFTVIGAGVVSEVWLNTVNSQTFLGLLGIVILFADFGSMGKRAGILWTVILGISCLSGAYCFILAPFFILKALLSGKGWYKRAYMIVASAALLIQGIIIAVFKLLNYTNERRTFSLSGIDLKTVLLHQVVRPLFGYENTKVFSMTAIIITLVCIVALAVAAFVLSKGSIRWGIAGLSVLFIYYLVFTTVTALSAPGGRYAVVSGTILIWLVIVSVEGIFSNVKQRGKPCLWLVVCIPLVFGIIDFQGVKNTYLTTYGHASWKSQIQAIKDSGKEVEGREIKSWPDGWTVILEK